MKFMKLLAAAVLVTVLGCGGEPSGAPRAKSAGAVHQADAEAAKQTDPAIQRKVIFRAQATLVVDTFDGFEPKLDAVIRSHKGAFISHSDVNNSPGLPRSGSWTVRVPADDLDTFLDEVASLGELHQRKLDSDDVTDQYYDRENRLKNKLARQVALRERLKKSTDKEESYLAVDRELAKVTQDIEADQRQLQVWSNLSALATIDVTVRERKDYVPPTAPSFGTSISRTFRSSLDGLVQFGKFVVLFVVALTPWLPLLALIVVPLWLLIRRALRTPQLPVATLEAVPATPATPPEA